MTSVSLYTVVFELTKNPAALAALTSLDYIPMPDNVVNMIQAKWKSEIKSDGGKPVY